MNTLEHTSKPTTLSSLALLLAILPGLTVANSAFDGLYIGASVGGTEMQADVDADKSVVFADTSPAPVYQRKLVSENSPDTYDTSGIAALRLGYGRTLGTSPFYLGLELFGNIADRDGASSYGSQFSPDVVEAFLPYAESATNVKVELNDAEYGFDFRPGILLSPMTLFYGRVGTAFNTLHLDVDDELAYTIHRGEDAPPMTFSTSIDQDESDSVVGLRLGLGLENTITNSLTLTADYIYTNYGSIDANGTFGVNNPDGTITANGFSTDTNADVATHAIMLGLNYYPQANKKHLATSIDKNMITHFNGFYGGAKGGVLVNNAKADIATSATFSWRAFASDAQETLSNSVELWDNVGMGEIFVGYGHLLENFVDGLFYIGIEAFGNLAERDLDTIDTENFSDTQLPFGEFSITNLSTTTQVKLNPLEWGADAKLGRLLSNNTLLYARVGFAVNEIKAQSDSEFVYIDNVPPPHNFPSTLYVQENKDVVGLRLGLGLEQIVWRTLAVTADYIYTDYGSINLSGLANTTGLSNPNEPFVTDDGFVNDTDIDVRTHAAMLGLAWHW